MPRLPKDPALRARRNKASTAATLEHPTSELKTPPLPKRLFAGGAVHRNTREWWKVIWQSPMAPRWIEADIEGLYLVAILRNEFFQRPTSTLGAEIRQQEMRFGLSPIDRRRLDWRIAGPIAKPEEGPAPPSDAAPSDVEPEAERPDPRLVLVK